MSPRPLRLARISLAGLLVLGLLYYVQNLAPHEPLPVPVAATPYQPMHLPGFVNSGDADRFECDALAVGGVVGVQQSFYLEDDMYEIADSLATHPMVDYDGQNKDWTKQELLQHTWLRLAQSSVWIEKLKVHLAVTRIEFYNQGVKHWPKISFLRGQIYDHQWNELRNHTVSWHGEEIVFPRIFDIPIPYKLGDGFFGPEDPRVVIEEGVDDAEPVIVFNMINDLEKKTRAMHLYRPFTSASTIMTIENQFIRPSTEKNWAPFFYNDLTHSPLSKSHKRYPSHFIHFVYDFRPFRIIRCHLFNGWCKHIFDYHPPDGARHSNHPGRISGGTNFVPLRIDPPPSQSRPQSSPQGTPHSQSFIGFPRTHMGAGCQGDTAIYRPELMVLTILSHPLPDGNTTFRIDYLSAPIDFMDKVLWPAAQADPCGEGHILIANSIARWDRDEDVMELSLTVDDSTTQMVRLTGVRALVEGLPLSVEGDQALGREEIDSVWSLIGQDVVGCSVQSAQVYAEVAAERVNGTDLRKEREEAEKRERERKEEEEKRRKEEDEEREKEQGEEDRKKMVQAEKAEELLRAGGGHGGGERDGNQGPERKGTERGKGDGVRIVLSPGIAEDVALGDGS